MRLLVPVFLLLFLVASLAGAVPVAHSQGEAQISVNSQYQLFRYGYAVVNETVVFTNSSPSPVQLPDITIGFGNLTAKIVSYTFAGTGFTVSAQNSTSGPYTVGGGQTLAASGTASFVVSVLLNKVVTQAANGSLRVLTLSSPSLSIPVTRLVEVVRMPVATAFTSVPAGLRDLSAGSNVTYAVTKANVAAQEAVSSERIVVPSTVADFHPLAVYSAIRTISAGPDGNPQVTDSIKLDNLGTSQLQTLVVKPLTTASGQVTLLPSIEPRLLSPVRFSLSAYTIQLSNPLIASPVPPGSNYTLTIRYALDPKYYSTAGGQVAINLPESGPIDAFVHTFKIAISLPNGLVSMGSLPITLTDVTPRQAGVASVGYAPTIGWGLENSIPVASLLFVLLLAGLFVSRSTATEEEETEEESSTERASAMIKAFDEKTSLINGLWGEVAAKDPNELSKEYFGELRGRLDAFRSRALQRLNEVRQKSTTQKFFDLLNQIHATEREVDRAAKDKLNLYEQFYMRRMRKDVFDRLLPQYTKRLERAL
ncbi:MAG: hypothetical protein HY297_01230, partial [Thaumarchaeota archaeon]|nr:hypothetical protein [Nitrososphaerota archaeon]